MIESAVWVGGTLTLAYPLAAWHWYGYRTWTTTTGIIVGYKDDPSPLADQGTLRAAVIRFETQDGQSIEVTDPVFTNTKRRVGSRVPVQYPPASPRHARLVGNQYTMQVVTATIGLMAEG